MNDDNVVTDEIKLRFEGVGSPAEIRAQRAARIEEIRKSKNRKAQRTEQRVNAVLSQAGVSRKDCRVIRQRAAKSKRVENYRWSPSSHADEAVS